MIEYSEPNYRISRPRQNSSEDITKKNPLAESTIALEDIKILGAQLRETKMNLNGLLEKQKEFCAQFGKDMSDEEFARLANAIKEIRENIACLKQMQGDIEGAMRVVLAVDAIYKEDLDKFEGKIEN